MIFRDSRGGLWIQGFGPKLQDRKKGTWDLLPRAFSSPSLITSWPPSQSGSAAMTTRHYRPWLSARIGFHSPVPHLSIILLPNFYPNYSPIFFTFGHVKLWTHHHLTILFAAWFALKTLCIFFTAFISPFNICLLRSYHVSVAGDRAMNKIDTNAWLHGPCILMSA